MKNCSNKFCEKQNPQPLTEFYDGRVRCKSCCRHKQKICRITNKEKVRLSNRTYEEQHRELVRLYKSKYKKSVKGKNTNRRCNHRRRARIKSLPATLTSVEWENILICFSNMCAYCGVSQSELPYLLEQDHIVPVSRGGGYTKDNIIPSCRTCNAKKGAKMLNEIGLSIMVNNE